MKVEIRYFASLADAVGASAETIEVDAAATVEELWRLLVASHPALGELTFRPLAACDLEYADWSRKLAGVGEVAFLPPVSGG